MMKGAAFGAMSGGMAYGIGHGFGLPDSISLKAVAHGVTQGVIGTARGGKFKASFLGSFVGHVVGGPIKSMMGKASVAARTTAAAIVGGVSAVAGGGKFANGATTAAFAHLFSEMPAANDDNYGMTPEEEWDSIIASSPRVSGLPGTGYGESAAQYWANLHVETGNPLYAVPGTFASLWTPDTASSTALTLVPVGAGAGAARALAVEMNFFSKGNVFKIISKRLQRGFRVDPAHHGKPWGHTHKWKWGKNRNV